MILKSVEIHDRLLIEDADADGFHIRQLEGSVYLTYEEWDNITLLLSRWREVMRQRPGDTRNPPF